MRLAIKNLPSAIDWTIIYRAADLEMDASNAPVSNAESVLIADDVWSAAMQLALQRYDVRDSEAVQIRHQRDADIRALRSRAKHAALSDKIMGASIGQYVLSDADKRAVAAYQVELEQIISMAKAALSAIEK